MLLLLLLLHCCVICMKVRPREACTRPKVKAGELLLKSKESKAPGFIQTMEPKMAVGKTVGRPRQTLIHGAS